MRVIMIVALAHVLAGCVLSPHLRPVQGDTPLLRAERLIDAFYSFNPARLRAELSEAPGSQPQITYYQGWAEGGNYRVLQRKPCRFEADDKIRCEITVRDDLIAALGTGYWVTDIFHLTLRSGRIVDVRTSSNDPPEFEDALNWLKRQRPQLMTGPCVGFFAGGPTPQDCVRAVVTGFAAYRAARRP
jgi:hypothetical protein